MSLQRRINLLKRSFRHRWCLFLLLALFVVFGFVFFGRVLPNSQNAEIDEVSHFPPDDLFENFSFQSPFAQKREIQAHADDLNAELKTIFRDGVLGDFEPKTIDTKTGPGKKSLVLSTRSISLILS